MKKVLLLGFILVVAVALVAGAFIYATWFDTSQEVEAHIVPDEDMPNMIQEDVKALAYTHFTTVVTVRSRNAAYVCLTGPETSPLIDFVRCVGAGTWIVKAGACAFTVDDRTGKVSP